jgi:hypothetical protein
MLSVVTRPIRTFVKRKLNDRGFHYVGGLGNELCTIHDYQENAQAVLDRSKEQTEADVAALKKKYEEPIIGEVPVERLLELLAQVIDPSNICLYCTSQLVHTLQVLESMEAAGITDREFLAATLVHDLGKLASLKGEKWENIEGGGKRPLGQNKPGIGLANGSFKWDHSDIVHARLKPYLSEDMAWLLKWHSIQPECEPIMDAQDRERFERVYKPFVVHDRTFIFYHLPKKRLSDYAPLIKEFFPDKVLF